MSWESDEEGSSSTDVVFLVKISIEFDRLELKILLDWIPLIQGKKSVYLWDYSIKQVTDQPVVYRFIFHHPEVGIVTVYIGEGRSLNGPMKNNLVYQYSRKSTGPKREEVRTYIRNNCDRWKGWTELLTIVSPKVDLSKKKDRKFLEKLLIGAYYQEHQVLKQRNLDIPQFLNKVR